MEEKVKKIIIGGLLLSAAMIMPATAGTIKIDSFQNGWANNSGDVDSTTGNIYSGFYNGSGGGAEGCDANNGICPTGEYRNWFAFDLDLAQLTGQEIISASITFYATNSSYAAGEYFSNLSSETFNLYNYDQSNIDALVGSSSYTGQFADLGMGTLYGSHNYQNLSRNSGEMIKFTMDLSAALSNMNANLTSASDKRFALGGAIQGLSSNGANRGLFGYSGGMSSGAAYLTIEYKASNGGGSGTVAAPQTMALLGFGLMGFAALRRRKTRA
jgi:hypothetical protein